MIIMDKFQKRVSKLSKKLENCLVIGRGFGNLEKMTEIFETVFVIDSQRPEVKARNLVYIEKMDNLSPLVSITAIFFDLDTVSELDKYSEVWFRCRSLVLIEGNDPIGRDKSQSLYRLGYECTSLQEFFHVWEPKK